MAKKPQNQAEKPQGSGDSGRDKKRHFELKNHRPLEKVAGIRRGVSRRFLEFLQPIKKGGVFRLFRLHKEGEFLGSLRKNQIAVIGLKMNYCTLLRARARARGKCS
jgi:hypothetical protein